MGFMGFSDAGDDENECSYFTTLWEFIDQLGDCNVSRKTTIYINFIVSLFVQKCRMSFQSYLTSHIFYQFKAQY